MLQITTKTPLKNIVHLLQTPVLILCDSENTKSVAESLGITGDLKDTNNGHWITRYPNEKIVQIVRQSCIDRITDVNNYGSVVYLV